MNTRNLLLATTITVLATSCGMNSGLTNHLTLYGNNTQVVLQEANYKVVGQVSGTASDNYVFGIGGFKKNLVEQARLEMIKKAELDGKARAIINMGLERHRGHFIFGASHSITVTGTVIEFEK